MDTWGYLPKDQIDPTTVDQEIDLKIIDHEADPDAHLEVGESLQSHKASEIIDHVVGSVLIDKLSKTEMFATILFESLDGFTITGYVYNDIFPGCYCSVDYGGVAEAKAISNTEIPLVFLTQSVDLLFQTTIRFDFTNTHYHAFFGYLGGYYTTDFVFGFRVADGVLFCQYYDLTYNYSFEVTGIDLSVDHVFRVQYNATSKIVTWYIDGIEIATYTVQAGTEWEFNTGPSFGVKVTESNDGSMMVGPIMFSRGF